MAAVARGWAGSGSTTRWRRVRLVVLERDAWQCRIKGPRCSGYADTVDHVVPLRDGGAKYDPGNLRAACRPCNYGRRVPDATGTVLEIRTAW